MPVMNGSDKEPSDNRQFIREKIVKKPISKLRVVKRIVVLCLSAVLFGAIAAATFIFLRPVMEEQFGIPTQKRETEQVTIPKDEPDTTAPPPSTTAPLIQESTEEEETEPIENVVQTAIEKYEYTITDLVTMHDSLKKVAAAADMGIVEVRPVKQNTDWFDNPIESTDRYSGALIARTADELLVLTPLVGVENVDSIQVVLGNNRQVDAVVKQTDSVLGLAVLSIDTQLLTADDMQSVKLIELGNSYSVKQGDLIIAAGSPVGLPHSNLFGYITYAARNVQVSDGVARVFYTDFTCNAQKGTFLLNTSGQLIGWVTSLFDNNDNTDLSVAMGISDCKGILELLTNGIAVPYMGIKGQDVTDAMIDEGFPPGIYIAQCLTDSPAYNVGIQPGDILTAIDNSEIVSLKELQTKMENLTSGQEVEVTVQRSGREEYTELTYTVTLGRR